MVSKHTNLSLLLWLSFSFLSEAAVLTDFDGNGLDYTEAAFRGAPVGSVVGGGPAGNYHKLLNLVESLELEVKSGKLRDSEVFIFTDNTTAEEVPYCGNSTSKRFFELVLRMQQSEMYSQLVLYVVHVSGTQMQTKGVGS